MSTSEQWQPAYISAKWISFIVIAVILAVFFGVMFSSDVPDQNKTIDDLGDSVAVVSAYHPSEARTEYLEYANDTLKKRSVSQWNHRKLRSLYDDAVEAEEKTVLKAKKLALLEVTEAALK